MLLLWCSFAAVVAIVKLDDKPEDWSVYTIYREAALRWQSGVSLYGGGDFLYLPTAAAGFIPFASLPFAWGGAVWRIANIGLFLAGLWSLRSLAPRRSERYFFPLISVVSMALSWSAARHGQMTLAMAGLMLLAATQIQREHWWRGALLLVLSVAAKPLAIVLALLLVVVHPKVAWRTAIVASGIFALPFLLQEPSYVLAQYFAVPDMLRAAAQRTRAQEFQELFALLQVLGVRATENAEWGIRGLASLAVVALAREANHRLAVKESAMFLVVLASCSILLLGSGTERNTYALMGPALAWFACDQLSRGRVAAAWSLLALAGLCLASYRLSKLFPDTPLATLKPLVCMALTSLAARDCWIRSHRGDWSRSRAGARRPEYGEGRLDPWEERGFVSASSVTSEL